MAWHDKQINREISQPNLTKRRKLRSTKQDLIRKRHLSERSTVKR
jgi:hypothetical protein